MSLNDDILAGCIWSQVTRLRGTYDDQEEERKKLMREVRDKDWEKVIKRINDDKRLRAGMGQGDKN